MDHFWTPCMYVYICMQMHAYIMHMDTYEYKICMYSYMNVYMGFTGSGPHPKISLTSSVEAFSTEPT